MTQQSTEHRLADVQGEGHSVATGLCIFPGLPVEGSVGWQNFIAQPSEVQTRHYKPQLDCITFVLDMKDDDDDLDPFSNPLPMIPIVCVVCEDKWQCRCAFREVHRQCTDKWKCNSRYWDCKNNREIPRSRSPPPPPASMVNIQRLRFSGNPQRIPIQSVGPSRATPAERAERRLADGSRTDPIHVRVDGQTDWETFSALLTANTNGLKKALNLERTRSEVMWALEDQCTTIWLPRHTDYQKHIADVVVSLPKEMRFKVGITVHPRHRFYEAEYAYSTPYAQKMDGVAYEGWILVFVHPLREVVAQVEHGAIKLFKNGQRSIATNRCANRKEDCDNHIEFDQSDEESASAPGPHWVYIAWGKWCHCTRRRGE